MIERFVNPSIKYTTTALGSLPGAKLYFTSAGTSTPKTVYKDGNKSVAHAYPVVANAYGIFEPIFLDGLYKVELKDSLGNTQLGWPIDNVGGNFSFVATDLTFTGTGGKILGDFSNSTPTNRLVFQTTTVSGNTIVDAIPATGGSSSSISVCNTDTNNYSALEMYCGEYETALLSAKKNSGSYLPFSLYVGGGQAMVVDAVTAVPLFTQGFKTTNSSVTDPLVMDWYEEGTFTPSVIGASTAGTCTYSNRVGKYQRVGNRLNFTIDISWSSHTGTGNLLISGLPFTIGFSTSASCFYNSLVVGSSKDLTLILSSSSSIIQLFASDPTGSSGGYVAVDAGASMYIGGFYFI